MSASDAASTAVLASGRDEGRVLLGPRERRVLRYAVGSTIAMALALGIAWPLSFIAPVLSLSFLASPDPRPTLRQGFGFVATIAIACYAGLWSSWTLIPFPLVFFPLLALLLLWIYYAKESGAPAVLITWLLITLLLLPMLAVQTPLLSSGLAGGIVFGAGVCMGLVWLSFGLFPDLPVTETEAVPSAPTAAAQPSASERLGRALEATIVVFPLVLVFHLRGAASSLLALIFVAILSMQPAFAKNLKVGMALIIGNAMGGLGAILIYELLVIVPEFHFMVLMLLLAGLFFGARIFSDRPTAELYKIAYSTLLLLTAMSTISGDEVRSKVYSRVLLIMLAVVYVVFAFGVIERFRKRTGDSR